MSTVEEFMRILMHLTTLFAVFLSACAAQTPPAIAPPDGLNVVLVVAREVRTGYGPLGAGERFPLEGRMVGYASLTWADVNSAWGQQKFEWRWFSGDRLVKRTEVAMKLGKPPHYAWNITQPLALGVGKGHVEFLWNGQVLAKRHFEVIDTTAAPTSPAPANPTAAAHISSLVHEVKNMSEDTAKLRGLDSSANRI